MSDEDWIKVKECKEWVKKAYGPYLEIVSENIPTVFYKIVRKDLNKHGSFYFVKKDGTKIISKTKCTKPTDIWNHYEPDKYRIVIAISDTINQYIGTKDKSKYDAIYQFSSELCRQKLGLKCGVISVLIAQQAEDIKKIETNFKGQTELDKLKPSAATIKTCRAIYEHCTLCVGLFNPREYGQEYYNEIDITNLDCGKYLALIILKTREGEISYPHNEINICAEFDRDHFSEI